MLQRQYLLCLHQLRPLGLHQLLRLSHHLRQHLLTIPSDHYDSFVVLHPRVLSSCFDFVQLQLCLENAFLDDQLLRRSSRSRRWVILYSLSLLDLALEADWQLGDVWQRYRHSRLGASSQLVAARIGLTDSRRWEHTDSCCRTSIRPSPGQLVHASSKNAHHQHSLCYHSHQALFHGHLAESTTSPRMEYLFCVLFSFGKYIFFRWRDQWLQLKDSSISITQQFDSSWTFLCALLPSRFLFILGRPDDFLAWAFWLWWFWSFLWSHLWFWAEKGCQTSANRGDSLLFWGFGQWSRTSVWSSQCLKGLGAATSCCTWAWPRYIELLHAGILFALPLLSSSCSAYRWCHSKTSWYPPAACFWRDIQGWAGIQLPSAHTKINRASSAWNSFQGTQPEMLQLLHQIWPSAVPEIANCFSGSAVPAAQPIWCCSNYNLTIWVISGDRVMTSTISERVAEEKAHRTHCFGIATSWDKSNN